MLKKFLIGTIAVVAFTLMANSASAYTFTNSVVKQGMTGPDVVTVQTVVGVNADGVFGPMTAAAVKAWQASHGLVADGIVGPATMAAMNVGGTTPVASGCQPGWKVNPITGASCTTTSTPTTITTTGDAGDLEINQTTRGVESDVKEDGEENVLGFKLEAEDSDIAISMVKVELVNDGSEADSSEDLEDYIDEVKVFLGDEEVGSADADEFSRDRGTWDLFTESIKLSNAVVKEGDLEYLYVAVATKSIDTEDEDAKWDIKVTDIRYVDGTGAIMSAEDLGDETFGFDTDSDDKIDLKSSSANPDESTIKIEEDDESDKALVFAFKLEADDDSSDISVFELPIDVTVGNNTKSVGSIDEIISSFVVKVDGEEFDADIDHDFTGATGTATYMVEFDDDEFVVDAGDTVEVKVYLTFAEQGDEGEEVYDSGTTISLKVTGSEMDAEGEDDVTVGGSKTSDTHTLSSSTATIDNYSWTVASTGTYIDFFFNVDAEDDAFNVKLADIEYELVAGSTLDIDSVALTKVSGLEVTTNTVGSDYTVEEGTAKFKVRFNLDGVNAEWAEITMISVMGENVPEDDEVSPTATRNVNS